MKDPHQNIFYYYKGQNKNEIQKERQLEDNTTKALINLLEFSDDKVLKLFLHKLGVIYNKEKVFFYLQRKIESTTKQKVLLGISPEGKLTNSLSKNKDSRPDAFITSKFFSVLIENKIKGTLGSNQLSRHNKNFNGKIVIKSWQEIYVLLREIIWT